MHTHTRETKPCRRGPPPRIEAPTAVDSDHFAQLSQTQATLGEASKTVWLCKRLDGSNPSSSAAAHGASWRLRRCHLTVQGPAGRDG
jgi:hypothetical protein